jgi:hypothetical protein
LPDRIQQYSEIHFGLPRGRIMAESAGLQKPFSVCLCGDGGECEDDGMRRGAGAGRRGEDVAGDLTLPGVLCCSQLRN